MVVSQARRFVPGRNWSAWSSARSTVSWTRSSAKLRFPASRRANPSRRGRFWTTSSAKVVTAIFLFLLHLDRNCSGRNLRDKNRLLCVKLSALCDKSLLSQEYPTCDAGCRFVLIENTFSVFHPRSAAPDDGDTVTWVAGVREAR